MRLSLLHPVACAVALGAALCLPTALPAQRPAPAAVTVPRARLALRTAPAWAAEGPRDRSAKRHVLWGALVGASAGALLGAGFGAGACYASDDGCWIPSLAIGLPAAAGGLAGGTAGALLGGVVYWVRR